MKKLIASALFLGLFTFGCDRCGDPDPYFDIQGIRLDLHTPAGIGAQDSVLFENFSMLAFFNVSYYSQNHSRNFSLVPGAMAHSCADPGYKGSKETIDKIDLIAVTEFNQTYKAGAMLNEIAVINHVPIEEFVNRQKQSALRINGFDIQLRQQPDSTHAQKFRMNIRLTNGEEYTAETTPITIL